MISNQFALVVLRLRSNRLCRSWLGINCGRNDSKERWKEVVFVCRESSIGLREATVCYCWFSQSIVSLAIVRDCDVISRVMFLTAVPIVQRRSSIQVCCYF
ncbi:hypothetical protein VTL71DRAFT_1004 [Oculimacula yallundae]|uniref:Uncharacterized protein n=1 Tax=Oculimacula yallundae TaxID=86028 RepID=A0ABR4D1L9_9HELO